jgi:hypothetical protein
MRITLSSNWWDNGLADDQIPLTPALPQREREFLLPSLDGRGPTEDGRMGRVKTMPYRCLGLT